MRVQFYDWDAQIPDNQETTDKFETYGDFFKHYSRVMGWRFRGITLETGAMTDPFPQKSCKFTFHVEERKFSCNLVV